MNSVLLKKIVSGHSKLVIKVDCLSCRRYTSIMKMVARQRPVSPEFLEHRETFNLLMGKVIQILNYRESLVRVHRHVIDDYTLQMKKEPWDEKVFDVDDELKIGDIVLIQRRSKDHIDYDEVKFDLKEIFLQMGNVIDPLTNQRVAGRNILQGATDEDIARAHEEYKRREIKYTER